MKITINFFSHPKIGNSPEENEDYFYPDVKSFVGDRYSASIADGASEGVFSSEWSKIISELYVTHDCLINSPSDFIITSQEYFSLWKKDYVLKRAECNNPLLWYEKMALTRGTFSTLLGITLYDDKKMWNSYAIGDSCLIHLRENKILTKFPLTQSFEFNNNPILLSTEDKFNLETIKNIKNVTGHWEIYDTFYLMTDAIAHWFYKNFDNGKRPWLYLNKIMDESDLCLTEWIKYKKHNKVLKNDDMTVVKLELVE